MSPAEKPGLDQWGNDSVDMKDRIKELITESGMSNAEVARKIKLMTQGRVEVSKATVGDWRDGSMPAGDKLVALADVLGTTAKYLVTGKGPRDARQGDLPIDSMTLHKVVKALTERLNQDPAGLTPEDVATLVVLVYEDALADGDQDLTRLIDTAFRMRRAFRK